MVSHTPSVCLGGGTDVLTIGVVGEGAAPDLVFDCHCYNITQKRGFVNDFLNKSYPQAVNNFLE